MPLVWEKMKSGGPDDIRADAPNGARWSISRSAWGAGGDCWFLYWNGGKVTVTDTIDEAKAKAEELAETDFKI